MSDVIIAGLVMCGIIGLPVGLIITISRDHWWSKLLALIISCAIFFGVGCMFGQESVNDRDLFNNGVCVKCAALLCCAMVGSSLNWCGMRLLLYWH